MKGRRFRSDDEKPTAWGGNCKLHIEMVCARDPIGIIRNANGEYGKRKR